MVDGFSTEHIKSITASPRHYGFHATLKPPFELADNVDANALFEEVVSFSGSSTSIEVGRLVIASIGGFIALVPKHQTNDLSILAADCVRSFDRFRRPAGAREIAKRRAAGLTAAQEQNLDNWGYPYVLEEFRFHMTLTERLSQPDHDRMLQILSQMASNFTLTIDAISIFYQPSRIEPFIEHSRHALTGQLRSSKDSMT